MLQRKYSTKLSMELKSKGRPCVETWISPPPVPFPAALDTHCGSLC